MENLTEFKRRIRKLTEHRKHRIRNSLGVYDGYKYYRKNKPKDKKYILTESQYFSIIRQVNNLLAEEIIKGNDVALPHRMGTIELRKFDKSVRIDDDGKIITNLPVDWNSTLKLWYEDEESYRKKTLIRMDENELYKIVWNKDTANFNNKSFYEFVFNKDLKIRLKHNIKEGLIDAFNMGRRIKNVV